MAVQHPKVHKIAFLHPARGRERLVGGKVGEVRAATEQRVRNRRVELEAKGRGPLQNSVSYHRLHNLALPETRIAARFPDRVAFSLQHRPIGRHQPVETVAVIREDVLVVTQAEIVLLNNSAGGEGTPVAAVAADEGRDSLLEIIERRGRFSP